MLFFAAGFFAGLFFAGDFFATGFFTADFFATVFFATVFLALVFFALAFVTDDAVDTDPDVFDNPLAAAATNNARVASRFLFRVSTCFST